MGHAVDIVNKQYIHYIHKLHTYTHIYISLQNQKMRTELGGSVVTHETRIREVPASNHVAGQLG